MNRSSPLPNHPIDPRQRMAKDPNRAVARAQSLAQGLRNFRPAQDLPKALWEIAYLWEESRKPERPLLERLRILGLMATSLDQFFVEQLPLWQNQAQSAHDLAQLPAYVESLLEWTSAQLRNELLPTLTAEHAVRLYSPDQLSPAAREWLRRFFEARVFPLLTPLAVDPGHPFPFISSFSLNLIVLLRPEMPDSTWDSTIYARIKVPRLLPRFIGLPIDNADRLGDRPVRGYIQSEEVVRFFLPQLFPGMRVDGAFLFRVVRGALPNTEDDIVTQRRLRQRELNWPVVRLDVEKAMPAPLLDWLTDHLDAPHYIRFRLPDPLGDLHLVDLANLFDGSEGAFPLV